MTRKRLESIFTAISERDIKSYELAIVELKERISRIIDENAKLSAAITNIATFGLDYRKMTEAQQYELGGLCQFDECFNTAVNKSDNRSYTKILYGGF